MPLNRSFIQGNVPYPDKKLEVRLRLIERAYEN